ncbi:acetate--CoA ligase family protein [Methylocystis echinoides]|uniref:acetate--CoA ligase family protein n=1 Tax=Methylocystis echinoides TaxID=29468 RepID=UPI003437375D
MSNWRNALFAPRCVAVVGASATPGKAGTLFLKNLTAQESGFKGQVVAIHPSARELLGAPAYSRLDAAPTGVDLAVIVTPAASVPGVIEDCGKAGVPVAVVITGGFAEVGPQGAELQRRTLEAAAAQGVRLIGPNCFGVISAGCGLNASLSIGLPKKGGVSLITQSGAYGMAAYSRSMDEGVGFSKIVALGNKADLNETDILAYLADDPETTVIALLLESIRDGRRLFEALADITKRKPVVVLKTGRRPAGQRAAASHTAALSTDAVVVEAALRQAGAHVVEDGYALLNVAAALDWQPPLRGKNVAVITNSGGVGVELTDLLEEKGLAVPALSRELQEALARELPAHGSAINPIDVTTDWARFSRMYGACVAQLMESDEVDAVVPVLLQRSALMEEVSAAIIDAQATARAGGSQKPLHICWVAPRAADSNRARLLSAGIPCHLWPAGAATALAALRTRPAADLPPPLDAIASPGAVGPDGWIATADAFSLLARQGFSVAPFVMAASAKQACAGAAELGFPVVVKAERAGLTHKSDQGAVRLGLCDEASVARVYEDFCARLGPGPALVQKQSPAGLELVIGGRRDASFGPLVLFGLGGVWVEALNDVALRLAPFGVAEARAMLDELKGGKLLDGYRGAPPIDRNALAGLISELSRWFAAAGWVSEFDLNPIIGVGETFTMVDARMRAVSPR